MKPRSSGQNASLGREGWGAGFCWTLLYWTCDLGCLAIAFPAFGMVPPWRGLLIAYAAGKFAGLLPITPGGLGATAGSMSAALAVYDGTSPSHGGTSGALAAVLLYRLIKYWAVLPAGAVCYLANRGACRLPGTFPAAGIGLADRGCAAWGGGWYATG